MSPEILGDHIIVRRGEKIGFRCQRSGRCCSTGPNVALTAYDVCRIARYLGVEWRELRGRFILAVIADMLAIPVLRGLGDNVCVFLKYRGGIPTCSIYPARPLRCRLYPFQPISPSIRDRVQVDAKCPGVGKGKEIDPPWNLLEEYYWEVENHYRRLFDLVFKEGYDPLSGLEKLIDEVCREAEENPKWADLNYLETLW
jgi:Fe-S-cluster containining protein